MYLWRDSRIVCRAISSYKTEFTDSFLADSALLRRSANGASRSTYCGDTSSSVIYYLDN